MNIPITIKPLTKDPVLIFSRRLDCWFIGRWNGDRHGWEVSTSIRLSTESMPDPHIWHVIDDLRIDLIYWQALPAKPIDPSLMIDFCARSDCHHLKEEHSQKGKKERGKFSHCALCACPGFVSARVRENFGELIKTFASGMVGIVFSNLVERATAAPPRSRPAPVALDDPRPMPPLMINRKRKKTPK